MQVPPPTLGRDLATLLEAGEAADVTFRVCLIRLLYFDATWQRTKCLGPSRFQPYMQIVCCIIMKLACVSINIMIFWLS